MATAGFTERETYFDDVKQPAVLRVIAHILSYVFHPLFVPAIAAAVLIWLHPINNLLIEGRMKPRLLIMIFLYTGFFPGIAVFLLWRLKFIDNLYMRTQKERIIPFIISMFFFFWIYYVSRNLEAFPLSFRQFLMGIFLSSVGALFANIKTKISMHAIGMGGLVAFFFLQQATDVNWQSNWSMIALVTAGTVCTARMILSAHRPIDVYSGFFVGVLCQVAGYFIVGSIS